MIFLTLANIEMLRNALANTCVCVCVENKSTIRVAYYISKGGYVYPKKV